MLGRKVISFSVFFFSLAYVALSGAPAHAATVDIKVNWSDGPTDITYGTFATIMWTSTDATSCTASNGWSGAKAISGQESTGTLTSAKTYTMTCSGTSGSASDSTTVTITPPYVTLQANFSNGSITIASGASATLQWAFTHATSCTASNGWSGAKEVLSDGTAPPWNNTQSTGPITSSKTYVLTCVGPGGGSSSASVTVNISSSAPTVDLKANNSNGPITIAYGATAAISWTSTNATFCATSNNWAGSLGDWTGTRPASGSESTPALTSSRTYSLACVGANGVTSETDSVVINVNPPPTSTVDLKVNNSDGPITISNGATATLSWTSTNATSCTASNGWTGAKATSGSESTGSITSSKTYTLQCTGSGGTALDAVLVNIAPTVDIKANGSDSLTIAYNTSATLSWPSTNAQSCWGSGSFNPNAWKTIGASESTGNLTASKTYTIQCWSSSGVASNVDSVTVNVSAPPAAPTVDLKVRPFGGINYVDGPVSIPNGASTYVSWTYTNVTVAESGSSCAASNGWSGPKPVGNPQGDYASTGPLTSSKTYTITCTTAGGSASDSVTVNIDPPPTPTVDLRVNGIDGPVTIAPGSSANLSWTSTNATYCSKTNGWSGVSQPTSGSESTGNLTSSKIYSIQCWSANNSAVSNIDSVTVNVNSPTNDKPVAVAKFSVNGGTASSSITVTKGVQVSITGDAAGSSDPDLWPTANTGVAPGGKCEWNTDLNQGTTTYEQTISNPTSPSSCNTSSIGTLTFNDNPGTYTYNLLRITDAGGLQSSVATVSVTVVAAATTADLKVSTVSNPISDGPITVASGTQPTLTWTSANATQCVASNGWTGVLPATSGGMGVAAITTSTTYVLTCPGSGGNGTDSVTVNVNSPTNDKPSAVAKFSINGAAANSSVTVTKGVPVSITADASGSSDPDGWTTSGTGVSSGGKCEWNTDLNQGTTTYEQTISNPTSPSSCNTSSIGTLTFNDNPGTYTYNLLRITDAGGLQSSVATVSVTVVAGSGSDGGTSSGADPHAPVAVAKFKVNGGAPVSDITVTKGVPVAISLDASESSDPDGWTTSGTGVSSGGKCAWNTNLDQSKPAAFTKTIQNPKSPADCNIDLGILTFNDKPGRYTYTLLKVTDASGLSSRVAMAEEGQKAYSWSRLVPVANAQSDEATVSVTVVGK